MWACSYTDAISKSGPDGKISHILDVHGFQVMLNLDIRSLGHLAPSFDSFFAERIRCIYVVDMPAMAQFIANFVLPLLPPKSRKKVHFVRSEELPSFYDDLDLDEPTRAMLEELKREVGSESHGESEGENEGEIIT